MLCRESDLFLGSKPHELTWLEFSGPIDTPMLRANQANGGESTVPTPPLSRLGSAQEIANIVVFLLSDDSSYVTGASWSVDGGSNA